MRLRRTFFGVLAILALAVSCATLLPSQSRVYAQSAKGPTTGTLHSVGDAVGLYCPGYSTFNIYVGSGLSGATLTPYIAPNTGTFAAPSPGPTSSPSAVSPATLSGAGIMSGTLQSASYVYVVLTATSSGSASATVICTTGAPAGSSGGGGSPTFPPNQNVTVTAPTDAGGNVKVVLPAPSATQPVSGSVAVSSLPPPVQPSPLYTIPVTTPPPPVQPSPLYTLPVNGTVTVVAPTNAAGNVTVNDTNLLPTPAATASAGIPATSAPAVNALVHCSSATGQAISPPNIAVIKCDTAARLLVSGSIAAPVATTGAAVPGTNVNTNSIPGCVNPAGGTPAPSAGQVVVQPADANGRCSVNGTIVGPSTAPAAQQGNLYEATINSSGQLNVNVPAPTVTLPVTTAAPGPTCSPAVNGFAGCGLVPGPSTEPAGATGYYYQTVDSSGNANTKLCSGTACVLPTSSPNAAPAVNMLPIIPCANNAGTTNCAGVGSTFQSLNVQLCGSSGGCVSRVESPSDSLNMAGSLDTNSLQYVYNSAEGSNDRVRVAAEPGASGVPAQGFNAAGPGAPIICHQIAHISLATTQPTETVMVASAAGKKIYICAVSAVLTGTVAGLTALGSSTTNTCAANALTALSLLTPNGANQVAMGTGVGTIAQTSSGDALCAFLGGTPALTDITIMYEQIAGP